MKVQIGLVALLMACRGGETVIEKQSNSAPVVMIGSHSPDAEILEGYVETFRATVSDDDNEFDELSVAWYVGDEIVCDWEPASPAGESFCDVVFNEEDSNVIVEVRDPQGAGGRSEISVVIVPTDAPTAEILSPVPNSNHYSDQLIQFSAVVADNEDSPEELIVTWSSNLDGELILDTSPDADGVISDYGTLSEGQHALELKVEDSSGKISKDQLVVTVGEANSVPLCEILEPTDGTASVLGESLVLRGTASDANIPVTDLTATWYSDKDGDLGNSSITSNGNITLSVNDLSANDHVLGLRVEDEVGAVCVDEVLVSVGEAPIVSIEAPQSGEIYSVGESILFNGVLNDAEDSMSDLSAVWDSSSNGQIASGVPDSQGYHQLSLNTLEAGVHTITLTGTDSTGLIGSDTVTIRINTPPTQPTVSLSPSTVYATANLTATATGSIDEDGDPISFTYQWYENGVLSANMLTTVPATELNVGEVWTVRVTPNDGYADGTFAEVSVTVENSVPTVATPVISSNAMTVYNDSILSCSTTATDADEAVSPTYMWDLNGAVAMGATVDLNDYTLLPGDSISCTASVTDSNGGMASATTSGVVENRSPSLSQITVVSSTPTTQDTLACSVTSADLDGDVLTESIEWFVAGSSVGTGSTLDLSSLGVGPSDVVECVATVSDSSGASDQQSSTVTVINTNPTINVLTLSPSEPTLNDTLSCYSESNDVDGDSPSLSFLFTNQTTGSNFAPTTATNNVATLNVSATDADYDHVLTCSVTATDDDGGNVADSISTTIVNTAPVFDLDAVITPNTVEIGTNVACTATASDPDDGISSLTYVWQINGVQVSTGSSWTVNSTAANVGDSLTCRAIATDLEGNATASTSVPAIIDNTIPVVSAVTLNTLSPYTNDVLTVSHTTFDFNGDAVTLGYEWHVVDASTGQDSIVQTGVGSSFASLDGAQSFAFDRDDEVYVNVTPNDGTDDGNTVESDRALVLNSVPTEPTLALLGSGDPPLAQIDSLTCTVTSPATDVDGDSLLYTYNWYDPTGGLFQSLPNVTTQFDVLADTDTSVGLWECAVTVSDGTDVSTVSAVIDVESDWDGPLVFTNCGHTGRTGPTQSQCDSEYAGTPLDTLVSVSAGYQTWVVEDTAVYSIEVAGAQGGGSNNIMGGQGATLYGEFSLTAGTVVEILVGQLGGASPSPSSSGYSAGGGGGSFVTINGSPIVVAGGGGGAGVSDSCTGNEIQGLAGQTTELGIPGQSSSCVNHAVTPGYGGYGNGGTCSTGASSGAGYLGDSQGYSSSSWATKALAYINGGTGSLQRTNGADGGFGGGGAGAYGGGGGGGYSGGGTGYYSGPCRDQGGGGGGSYNTGNNQNNQSGVNGGHGYVIIDR